MLEVLLADLHNISSGRDFIMVDQHSPIQSTFSSPFSTKLISFMHWSSVTSTGRRLTMLQQQESMPQVALMSRPEWLEIHGPRVFAF